jgi:hypothetical protein
VGDVVSRRSMTDARFKAEDQVRIKATGKVGRIEVVNPSVGKNQVEFNHDFASREWFADDELELVSRKEDSSGPRRISVAEL